MDTSDPSATYVSWNPGKKLELKALISRSGNPRLTSQVCSCDDISSGYLQLQARPLHSSHLARRDFLRFWTNGYSKNCQIMTKIILKVLC
jgi:hypothetical protein